MEMEGGELIVLVEVMVPEEEEPTFIQIMCCQPQRNTHLALSLVVTVATEGIAVGVRGAHQGQIVL